VEMNMLLFIALFGVQPTFGRDRSVQLGSCLFVCLLSNAVFHSHDFIRSGFIPFVESPLFVHQSLKQATFFWSAQQIHILDANSVLESSSGHYVTFLQGPTQTTRRASWHCKSHHLWIRIERSRLTGPGRSKREILCACIGGSIKHATPHIHPLCATDSVRHLLYLLEYVHETALCFCDCCYYGMLTQ